MSENCELRRGLRRREKNANDEGAGHFEKPAPDARAAPPEAHESLISRETVAEVLLTGLFLFFFIASYFGVRRSETTTSRQPRGVFPSIIQRSVCGNSHIVTVGSSAGGAY